MQVEWISTEDPFSERFHLYLSPDFYEHRIHVFSIFNAFMMVIFLCGLVALILVRTLKQDFAKVGLSISSSSFIGHSHI